jgi:GT2 family glycosyltransferase
MNIVSIIMVNFNSTDDTIECLDSLYKLNIAGKYLNIITIDNFSNDLEKNKLFDYINKNGYKKIEVINKKISSAYEINIENITVSFLFSDYNYGFSGANNIGIEYALSKNSDYFWILNNDTIVDTDSISFLMKMADENGPSLIGSTICEYYKRDVIQCTAGFKFNELICRIKKINSGKNIKDVNYLKIKKLDCISGCSIFFNYQTFNKIGFFDESYFLYFEEVNLKKICEKNNINTLWCKKSIVWHKEGKSIGSKNIKHKKSDTSEYYGNLSCLIYFKKYYSFKFFYIFIYRFIARFIIHLFHFDFRKIKILCKAYRDFSRKKV